MPANTPKQSIPYPVAADKISDYPALTKTAMEKIDTLLSDTGWVPFPFTTGWSGSLVYRVKAGVCYLQGAINGTHAANSVRDFGTLPAEARPNQTLNGICSAEIVGQTPPRGFITELQVASTGVCTLTNAKSNASALTNARISMSYPVAD